MRFRILANQRGLTLIEILFATVFLVLILLLISSIFHKNLKVTKKVIDTDARREECRFTMENMLSELREAEEVSAPDIGLTTDFVIFKRPGATSAVREGENVTYSYNVSQRSIMRSDDSGGSPVVMMEDVDFLSFRRIDTQRIDVEISVPGIEAKGGTSGFAFKSMATIRRLTFVYSTVYAPAEISDVRNKDFCEDAMGGIW